VNHVAGLFLQNTVVVHQPQATAVVTRSVNVSYIKWYDIPYPDLFTVYFWSNVLQLSHLPHAASDQDNLQARSSRLDDSDGDVFSWLVLMSTDLAILLCSIVY